MAKAYACTMPDGTLSIIRLSPRKFHSRADYDNDERFNAAVAKEDFKVERRLPKSMFDLSAQSDISHYDDTSPTVSEIEAGLPGHFPCVYVEIDDKIDMPQDRRRRNDWVLSEGKVRIRT